MVAMAGTAAPVMSHVLLKGTSKLARPTEQSEALMSERIQEVDLRESGLLWLINRQVFHPRGYALGCSEEGETFFLIGDGTKPWRFADEDSETGVDEAAMLAKIKELMP